MHDGAIVFNTKIDNSNVEKDLKATEKKIRNAQESIYKNESAKLPLVKQAEQLGTKLNEAKQSLEYIRAEMASVQNAMAPGSNPADYLAASADYERVKTALDAQEKEVLDLQDQWIKVNEKVEEYDLKIQRSREEIERSTAEAGRLKLKLGKSGNSLSSVFNKAEKSASKLGKRLLNIGMSAFVFNVLSAGLRSMTSYFGKALKSNDEFSTSVSRLKGALLTAFQPIYEYVLPAIISLVQILTMAVQAVGRFFAALSGKSYSDMKTNAESIYDQANAIDAVGGAAKEAKKQLMGFDEINKLESTKQGGGGGISDTITPDFSSLDESGVQVDLGNILRLVSAVSAALLTWKIASAFTSSLSLAAGLAMTVGGAILYATSWADAFANGINWKNLTKMLGSAAAVVAGLALAFGTTGAAVGLLITGIGLVILSMREWITTGELTNEACASLVIGIMAIGAAIALFTGNWIPLLVAGIASAVVLIAQNWDSIVEGAKNMLAKIQTYLSETFADGFINGVITMIGDAITFLWNIFVEFINGVIENWNSIWSSVTSYQTTGTIPAATGYSASSYSTTPDIPQLARGAVIPPNREFLAVLGDQSHGRNLEAPEELIRQIVRDESGAGGSDKLAQLLETLISVVEGIEVGDETIGRAAARYNRSTSRARGY